MVASVLLPTMDSFFIFQFKVCSLCNRTLSRKDYLTHFKDAHAEVRLGCPKCPQTYHSPELLNLHYRHFHAQQPQPEQHSQEQTRQETSLDQCRLCKVFVSDMERHCAESHPGQPTASGSTPRWGGSGSSSSSSRRSSEINLYCDICFKIYHSQREFTNHRRRKNFCKPPASEEESKPVKRRIGIIRRSL